ncbi:DNA replication licensing factor MCM6 [Bienertia sinuspersici]
MDSPQSVVSPFQEPDSRGPEPEKPRSEISVQGFSTRITMEPTRMLGMYSCLFHTPELPLNHRIPKQSMDADNAEEKPEAFESVLGILTRLSFLTQYHNESHELGVRIVESFSANSEDSKPIPNADSPPSSVSTNGSPSVCLPTSSQSSEAPVTSNKTVTPLVTVNVEPEEKLVQQDIVDMYMKSMQQFTESLAK